MSSIKVCDSAFLENGGLGCRFNVLYNGEPVSAFVVRVEGQVRGFLNRCSHLPVEMDWNYAEFLDDSAENIVCATHGAMYDAQTGACIGGPCSGTALVQLQFIEKEGGVFWCPSELVTVPSEGIED